MNERDIPTSHGSCHHITTTQIRSEYKFEVKFCLNTPSGSKEYGIYVTFVPVSTDLLLYWPMPFKIAVEIAAVDRDTDSVVKSIPDDLTSPPDDWSAYIGNEQGTLEDRNRRVGWFSIITGSRLKSTAFMRNRKITFIIHIYTEAPGE